MKGDDKCKVCKQIVKGKSICCDGCNKWLHFKCSKLSQEQYQFHVDNEIEFWRCEYCVVVKCKICSLLITRNQDSIGCDICQSWVHQKCSGISKKMFKEIGLSNSDWFCRICIRENLPFSSLDNKNFAKVCTNEKIKRVGRIPECALPMCSVCNKANLRKDLAIYCRNCKHLCHRKCIQMDKLVNSIDLCATCLGDVMPFQHEESIVSLAFNSNHPVYKLNYSSAKINPTLEDKSETMLETLESSGILDLLKFTEDKNEESAPCNVVFNYYSTSELNNLVMSKNMNKSLSLIHTNIESLQAKEDRLKLLLTSIELKFDIIALTETWNHENKKNMFIPPIIEGYLPYEGTTGSSLKGGCGFYIKDTLNYIPRPDLDYKICNNGSEFECKWIELINHGTSKSKNIIIGVHYRHPRKNDDLYINYLRNTLKKIRIERKKVLITGDFNYNLLNYRTGNEINEFLGTFFNNLYLPHITGPTRITNQKPSLIDNIYFNDIESSCVSGNLLCKISDHLPNFIIIDN